jgi:hypothetical protein
MRNDQLSKSWMNATSLMPAAGHGFWPVAVAVKICFLNLLGWALNVQ